MLKRFYASHRVEMAFVRSFRLSSLMGAIRNETLVVDCFWFRCSMDLKADRDAFTRPNMAIAWLWNRKILIRLKDLKWTRPSTRVPHTKLIAQSSLTAWLKVSVHVAVIKISNFGFFGSIEPQFACLITRLEAPNRITSLWRCSFQLRWHWAIDNATNFSLISVCAEALIEMFWKRLSLTLQATCPGESIFRGEICVNIE